MQRHTWQNDPQLCSDLQRQDNGKSTKSNLSGFTLVEVMIVIGIVMVVVGILMPVVASAKRSAKKTACSANLSQLSKAIILYSGDNDNIFPRGKDCADLVRPWSFPSSAKILSVPLLHELLKPYISSTQSFHCPEDSGTNVVESSFPEKMLFSPSVYSSCGNSYEYRTELGLANIQDAGLKEPSSVNVLADLAGHWHGSTPAALASDNMDDFQEKAFEYRYEIAFADGHVKIFTHSGLEAAWRKQ